MQSLHFLYHELRTVPSTYSYVLDCSLFEKHCELFGRLQNPESGMLRPIPTFDDGNRSDYELASPILQRHGLTAHFFITAGWTGNRAGYMTANEIRGLKAAHHQIGAHGWSHKLLTHCKGPEIDQELRVAKESLEDILGNQVSSMSLPGGRANRRVLDACWAAGYEAVYTSVPRAEPFNPAQKTTVGRLNLVGSTTPEWLSLVLQPSSGLLVRLERRQRAKDAMKTILGDGLYTRLWGFINHDELESVGARVGSG